MSLKLYIFPRVKDSDDEHEVGDLMKGGNETDLRKFWGDKIEFPLLSFSVGALVELCQRNLFFVCLFVCFFNFAFS